MRRVVELARRVARTDANVLIAGESGAGKDFLALHIHRQSPRHAESFTRIDCAALPGELLEAELFGYERGAFTGATHAKPGRLEAAQRGTLVLDEIASLRLEAQAKLLRVIERREFERLGGKRTIKVDARLIALTNVDLREAIKRREFREDLFHRLNVVQLNVPPLRERRQDVNALTRGFLKIYARKHNPQVRRISPEATRALEEYGFPGNVRELSNIIERAVIVAARDEIAADDLPEAVRRAIFDEKQRTGRLTLAAVEAAHIAETLRWARGNKSVAARALGISRKNLYERLARMEVDDAEE